MDNDKFTGTKNRELIYYVISKDTCPEDGMWCPETDSPEQEETKHYKKGEKFPLYKGQKVAWRLISRDNLES